MGVPHSCTAYWATDWNVLRCLPRPTLMSTNRTSGVEQRSTGQHTRWGGRFLRLLYFNITDSHIHSHTNKPPTAGVHTSIIILIIIIISLNQIFLSYIANTSCTHTAVATIQFIAIRWWSTVTPRSAGDNAARWSFK